MVSRFVPWLLTVALTPGPCFAQQFFVPPTAPQLVASRLSASFFNVPNSQDSASGTIKVDRANVRANPTLQGAVVATLPKGTVLHIERNENGWLRVTTATAAGRQVSGWIAEGLVDRTTVQPTRALEVPTLPTKAAQPEATATPEATPAPLPRLNLADAHPTVPSRDEQLWLQDVMRTKRDRTKAAYLLYGGAGLIVLGIFIDKTDNGYEQVTAYGTSLAKTLYVMGAAGIGYGFYSKQKADKQWQTLMDEGKQRGFSVRVTRKEAAVQLAMSF